MRSKCVFKTVLILSVVYIQTSSAIIYNLNDTEYKKLPPIFHGDSYDECMRNTQGLYCSLEALLVSDEKNPLLSVIQEFSAHKTSHYNHSLLRYYVCVTDTCKDYHDNRTGGIVQTLEACLNRTIYKNYGLKTKVLDKIHCKRADDVPKVEVADICMFGILIGILVLNIVGSLYEIFFTNGEKWEGNRFLICFAIRRNWKKLMSPALEGPDSRLERLKVVSSAKCLTTVLVISAHTMQAAMFFISNPEFTESGYKTFGAQLFLNSTVIVQTFFIMSGFLLSYNLELMAEKPDFKVNWKLFPKSLFMRWLRLTPMYAIVLGFIMTCNKFLISGPLWHIAVVSEVADCQKYWWQHILYINNYNDVSVCMMPSWYLAADTQLYCLGIFLYICCRSAASRKLVLTMLLLLALLIPVLHTYFQDLDGVVVFTPEDAVNVLVGNDTYNELHKRGHTNIFSYVVGMVVGWLAYHGQKINYDVQKLRKYRIVYYSMVPIGVVMVMTGSVFLREGERPSLPVRMVFAAYQKLVWSLLIGTGLLGIIFKYEEYLRGFFEWRGWTVPSRLSYCSYLVHEVIIRLCVGLTHELTHVTMLSLSEHVTMIIMLSYVAAVPCWLMMEQPIALLVKMLLGHSSHNKTNVLKEAGQDKKHTLDEQMTRV